METNWPQNWRLTVLETIKMTLVIAPITSFKMTGRADCAVSAFSPLPLPVRADVHWLWGGGELAFGQKSVPLPPLVACIQSKANFPFYQVCLFIGFWVTSGRTPLPVMLSGPNLLCWLHNKSVSLRRGVRLGRDFIWEPADREGGRLVLQNNDIVRAWMSDSFMDQRWGEVRKQSKKTI